LLRDIHTESGLGYKYNKATGKAGLEGAMVFNLLEFFLDLKMFFH